VTDTPGRLEAGDRGSIPYHRMRREKFVRNYTNHRIFVDRVGHRARKQGGTGREFGVHHTQPPHWPPPGHLPSHTCSPPSSHDCRSWSDHLHSTSRLPARSCCGRRHTANLVPLSCPILSSPTSRVVGPHPSAAAALDALPHCLGLTCLAARRRRISWRNKRLCICICAFAHNPNPKFASISAPPHRPGHPDLACPISSAPAATRAQ